jgi:hypothetical protein
VGALNNPEVGKYVNEFFVSSYQKVATFKIVNGNKQGGNVAAYFCAPDGRVLHCVAGPWTPRRFSARRSGPSRPPSSASRTAPARTVR